MDATPRRNLSLVKELGDRAAQGRAYGNLGNTHYLLGSFMEATAFHKEVSALWGPQPPCLCVCHPHRVPRLLCNHPALGLYPQRLAIAKEFGDKAAERRAYSNLGNAHIFMGRFDVAAEYYK